MAADNPFADYGGIVRGERFIGRQGDLRVIEARVLRPAEPGNLAVIGEPRVGKSSLIYRGVMDRREELLARRRLPVWLNLATFDQSAMLFRSLVMETSDQLDELGWSTPQIAQARARALEDSLSWTEGYGRIQRFFQKVRESGVQILFVLDEFDAARLLFRGDLSGFQGLRELAYRPEWRVSFVTTSRRSIRTIEAQSGVISTLDGIFQPHYLGMFSEQDFSILLHRLEETGALLEPEARGEIEDFCGRHPFLLERFAFSLVEQHRHGSVDLAGLSRDLGPEFVDHYEKTTALLREEGVLPKLLQILFGPVVDATEADVEDLLRYGVIQRAPDRAYRAFSGHFERYLRLISREVDLWPLWTQTERELRSLISLHMVEKYGERWPEKLEKAHPKLKPMLDSGREAQAREQHTFGGRASPNLLDFTYPDDLYQILRTDWNWFRPVFGREAKEWQDAFAVLARVRTPLAHNRDAAVYESDRLKAQGFCREILNKIEAWRQRSVGREATVFD